MKNALMTVAMVGLVPIACRQQNPGTAVLPSASRQLTVTVGGKTHSLDAGEDCFWQAPVFNPDNSVAYVMRNSGTLRGGYSALSIVRISREGVTDPVFQNADLAGTRNVMKIHRVSDDGKTLLVDLHYLTKRTGHAEYYDTRPVLLDVASGKIREVEL